MLRDWFRLSLSSLGIFKLTLKKLRKPLKTPWKDLEFLGQKMVGTLACNWAVVFTSADNWYFTDAGLSTKKQNVSEVILQIPSMCKTSHCKVTDTNNNHRINTIETRSSYAKLMPEVHSHFFMTAMNKTYLVI